MSNINRSNITGYLWGEMKTQFLHDITTAVHTHDIPDEPIWNVNQIPSEYVPTSIVTMRKTGGKHISVTCDTNKHAITSRFVQILTEV